MLVAADGYLSFQPTTSVTNGTMAAGSSFNLLPRADGSVLIVSRHPLYSNYTMAIGTNNAHICGGSTTMNMRAQLSPPAASVSAWRFVDAMASSASYAAPYSYETVMLDSMAGAPGTYVYAPDAGTCGAGASLSASVSWLNATATWTILPAIACPAVCGASTFTLRAANNSAAFLYVNASGALVVGSDLAADFTPLGASFVAWRANASGVTGWVLSSGLDYAVGNVLTASAAGTGGACGTGVSSAPVGPGGLSPSNLWHLFWVDGAGDLAAIPAVAASGAATSTQCARPSTTPLPTVSITSAATPSLTPTSTMTATLTPTPSVTPSQSPAPSVTPSNTPSPSGTQLSSLTPTPSTSASGSRTLSSSPTPSLTAPATNAATGTPTATPTPTPTPRYRVAASLWIDMNAVDYNDAVVPQTWDNRASAGITSINNGDFVTSTTTSTFPRKTTIGGVPAVLFNSTATGASNAVTSSFSYFPASSFYGATDWSVE